MSLGEKTYGIRFSEKIGYALGDAAGLLTFGLVGSFLQKFYTNVMYIDPGKITVLFLVARIWDAINDPLWGGIIDRRKPGKNGKYRPYLRWASIPLAVFAVLMFLKVPGFSENQYLIWAYITYIGYGMMYTAVNIPYGSLASVITTDANERSALSMFRSIGAGLGGTPAQILLPLFVYSTAYDANGNTLLDETGKSLKVLDGQKLFFGTVILAVLSIVIYQICFKMTKERVHSIPVHAVKTQSKQDQIIETATSSNPVILIHRRKIIICILLSIITLGIYDIYWIYLLVKNTKALKNDKSSCLGEMLCLIFVPFYSLYWWYTRGNYIKNAYSSNGNSTTGSGILYLILGIFGLDIISIAIMQHDFNSSTIDNVQFTEQNLINTPFIVLCFASMLLITAQQFTQATYNYLFEDYFHKPGLYSLFTVFTYLPMALLLPVLQPLVRKFGKKEICAAGMAFSAVAYALMWLSHTPSVWVFLAFCFLAGLGMTFFVLEIWAMVTDVIDYQALLSGKREEGTSYAFFSFTRKLGQALAGVLGTQMLKWIAYDAKNVTAEAVEKMYTVSTALPALMCLLMALSLGFCYSLSKKKLHELFHNDGVPESADGAAGN